MENNRFDIFYRIAHTVSKQTWICLASGIVFGWITHFYMLSHKFTNWDDVNNLQAYGSGDFLGRWFLKYIHPLGTVYSVPAIHGLLMIVFLTLSAYVVIKILHLKTITAAVLVPMLMVTFPSVACIMSFMFMAHTSGIGIFMFCLAVYLQREKKWGMIPSLLLMICSLGIYQSYVSIAIVLFLLGMLVDILEGKDFRCVLKKGVQYAISLIATVIIYMILCHIIYPNIGNETYGGVGNMGQIAIADMPRLIGRCYKRFLEFFLWKPFDFVSKPMQCMNICTIILGIGFGCYLFIKRGLYHKKEGVLYVLCGAFVPWGAAFVYFMAPEVSYSMLMLYSYVLIYCAVIMLWENMAIDWQLTLLTKSISWILVCVMLISCYTNFNITNLSYLRTDIAYQRVFAYYNRILANVESTEGYQTGDQITLLGEFHYIDNPSVIEGPFMKTDEIRSMDGIALENGLLTLGTRDAFIRYFMGLNQENLSVSERAQIMEKEEYKQMPVYPTPGSIQKIDDIWVVKLCE